MSRDAIELFILVGPLNVMTVVIGLLLYDFVNWLGSLFSERSKAVDRG